ncbi:carbon storage regulator [Planctomycetaceae bacterium SH139]
MLVLSRKEGERLVIGENVVVTVNRISGNRITLGIEAPRDVRIVRGELEQQADSSQSVDPQQETAAGQQATGETAKKAGRATVPGKSLNGPLGKRTPPAAANRVTFDVEISIPDHVAG